MKMTCALSPASAARLFRSFWRSCHPPSVRGAGSFAECALTSGGVATEVMRRAAAKRNGDFMAARVPKQRQFARSHQTEIKTPSSAPSAQAPSLADSIPRDCLLRRNQTKPMNMLSRRRFLWLTSAGAAAVAWGENVPAVRFFTRGVVLTPEDFSLREWPEWAHSAGLTTIALHHGRAVSEVVKFVDSDPGQDTLAQARRLGLEVEYELHAMSDLLPRRLFEKERNFFRMDEKGDRVPDYNLCVHSARALEIVAENAVLFARTLRPTTGRYFFWGDDGRPWCHCSKCRDLSDSEQALVMENAVLKALCRHDERATLAHLAYAGTMKPPHQVKPERGVFLEHAPIGRRYDLAYAEQREGRDGLDHLDANLNVFPSETAQVLDYWLDVSRFSDWRRPAKKLPWRRDVFLADLETYAARGIRHVTTFAVFIDAEYVKRHGKPDALQEYGDGLRSKFSLPNLKQRDHAGAP